MEFEILSNLELDSLDDVPDAFKPIYIQTNGKFTVPETFKALAMTVDGLGSNLKKQQGFVTSANTEAKTNRESLKAILAAAGVSKAEDLTGKLADLEAKVAAGATVKPEEIKAAVAADFQGKLDAASGTNQKLVGTLEKILVDNAALAAVTEAKGSVKLLMPLIKQHTKVIPDENGEYIAVVVKSDGTVRANASGSPMTVAELVAEFKKDTDLASAFQVTTKTGGGSPTGQGTGGAAPTGGVQTGLSKIQAGLAARS